MHHCRVSSLVLVLLCAAASAEPRTMAPAAKQELDRGLAKYAAHDYAAAITLFDAGYAIDPHPDFMYAKAQAQRLGGDCRGAIASYNAFLASNPPEREAGVAKTNIAKCEALLAASEPSPPAEPLVEPAPPPPPVEHKPPPPPTVVVTHEPSPWWHDSLGLTFAAGSLISLGVSVGFTFEARSDSDDQLNAPDLASWLDARDAWDRDRIVAGVTAGAGAVLAGLAIWRFATHSSRASTVTAHVGRTRDTTVVGVEGRW